jgi:5-formyltetrahydrofolate cyclo-ligase
MTFVPSLIAYFRRQKKETTMSAKDQERLALIKEIQQKGKEVAAPVVQEMRQNQLENGESSVELYSNAWVVKSHNQVSPNLDYFKVH